MPAITLVVLGLGARLAAASPCAPCHAAIEERYRESAMAQSFGRMTAAAFPKQASLAHAASGKRYEVLSRGGIFRQRRFVLDEDGAALHSFEQTMTHAIGSGRHARTYLHLSAEGELTQLPLSWYAQEQRWAMSPGYDQPRHADFARVVDFGCLFCHAAYPRLEPGASAPGMPPRFPQQLDGGIDCQRCHGDGAAHAATAGKAPIGNPARLPAGRALDVCLQCHLQTTSDPLPHAIRRTGRGVFSFRPGEALSDYAVHFDYPDAQSRDTFEINGHGYRMLQSACFRNSGGKLSCVTCHDPHGRSDTAEAKAQVQKACLSCHAEHAGAGSQSCAGCHMPRRRTEDAVSVVMTDHRIRRDPAPAGWMAPRAERHGPPYRGELVPVHAAELPPTEREVHLGIALLSGGADRAGGIALLRGRASAVEALAALAQGEPSEALYRRILALQPALAGIRAALAEALRDAGRWGESRAEAQAALPLPRAAALLARLAVERGEAASAIPLFERAAVSAEWRTEALSNLGNLYTDLGKPAEARAALERALAFEPHHAEGQNNYGRLLAMEGDLRGAIRHLRRAVAASPDYGEAHYNLGAVLVEEGRLSEAIPHLERAVVLLPTHRAARAALARIRRP